MNSNGAYRSVIMHVLKIIVVVASCLCMVLCSTACGPGGATSADGTASAPAGVSSSEPVQPDYLKTYADFTVPGLRSYAESKMMTSIVRTLNSVRASSGATVPLDSRKMLPTMKCITRCSCANRP